jgi:acyl-CoA reductase-like NAD-dependent aldehyde dehydrogenase
LITTEVAPFGGIKQSGLGKEGSKYGLDEPSCGPLTLKQYQPYHSTDPAFLRLGRNTARKPVAGRNAQSW